MALTYQLILLLGLSSGLWMGADAAYCAADCCMACPDGWLMHSCRCFQFFNEPKDWSDAEKECIDKGGNLASFRNNEIPFVRNLVKQFAGGPIGTWLGGYDAVKENVWKWSNGDKFDFTGWPPGEPNNVLKKEHCMEVMGNAQQKFNDAPCGDKKAFLCVRNRIATN